MQLRDVDSSYWEKLSLAPPQKAKRQFRSRDAAHLDMAALYVERYMGSERAIEALRSGCPIVGIAQSGSDLNPCNRVHVDLAQSVSKGICDAGGIPLEFPTFPLFETCRRPTAALDRNLAYISLVEVLLNYPLDAVVLTTGCDKTTPSAVMAASTVDIPAIVLSGGPMLDSEVGGELVGSGLAIWKDRRRLGAGDISPDELVEMALASAPSLGHCNTMGTASTMNAVAEALGLSLPGCAAIPAPYADRGRMAYATGKRIVEMAYDDLKPSDILRREAFLNAISVVAAIGGSTNAQPHIHAMARHAGVEISAQDWMDACDIPLLVNMQPAGKYLGERFYRAGGVPSVLCELLRAGRIDGGVLTVTGMSLAENIDGCESPDREMIASFEAPFQGKAGFVVMTGNLFDFAVMKTSVISDEFRARYLSEPGHEGIYEGRAVVFDGGDDYHSRINDPSLQIDENTILVMRGAGPIGWPGSAEVINMQPPDALLKKGIVSLPTIGDGRQSGTSDSPSILNASPESAMGGGLGWLRTGDRVRIDVVHCRCDALVSEDEIARRMKDTPPRVPASQSPWQEMFRATTGQLDKGAVMELAVKYRELGRRRTRDVTG